MVQWQTIPVSLFGGVQTKVDDKSVQLGKLLTLENARLEAPGIVKKRKGYSLLSKQLFASTSDTVQSGTFVRSLSDKLVIAGKAITDDHRSRFLVRTEQDGRWNTKLSLDETDDIFYPLDVTVKTCGRSFDDVVMADIAIADGITCVVYERTDNNSIYLSAFDEDNGISYFTDLLVADGSTTAKSVPRICATDNNFFMFCAEVSTNKIFSKKFSVSDVRLATVGTGITMSQLVTDLHADGVMDCCKVDSDSILLVYKDTVSDIQLRQQHDSSADDTGSLNPSTNPSETIACAAASNGGTDYFIVAYTTGGTLDFYLLLQSPVFNVSLGPVSADSSIGTATQLSVVKEVEDAIRFVWGETNAGIKNISTLSRDFSNSGVDNISFTYGVDLASKAFSDGNQAFFWLAFDSDVQGTYYLARPDSSVTYLAGMSLSTSADSQRTGVGVSSVITDANSRYVFAGHRKDRLLSDGVVIRSPVCISTSINSAKVNTADIENNAFIGGGMMKVFNESLFSHAWFLTHPEIVSLSDTSTGGSMSDGTYSYRVVAEWTDYSGQVYRSAPSAASSITLSGGTSTQKVTVTFKQHLFPMELRAIEYFVYRTTDAGTIYYKTGASETRAVSTDRQSVDDTADDATIDDNEIIYTNGGILENNTPHGSNTLTYAQNRLFYVPFDDRRSVYFSKQKETGLPFEFNNTLKIDASRIGEITAIGSMDTNIIVYTKERIGFFFGEGPNKLGFGQFAELREVASDVGCVSQESLVETHVGHFFQSGKGIYLLDRSMQTHYIGYDVESFNSNNVIRSVLLENEHQVAFVLDDSATVLVYHYNLRKEAPQAGEWSVWKGHSAVDATSWNDTFVWIDSAGQVYQQDGTTFQDGSTSYALKIVTPWIAFAGMQGFQRVRRIGIVGDKPTDHTMTVKVMYDFDETVSQTLTVATSTDLSNTPINFRRRLNKQKCQSLKFEISDASGSGTEENYAINQLALEVGIKRGINRVETAG